MVPELLDIMETALACEHGTAQQAKDFIGDLFSQNKDNQIALAFAQEMKYQLSLFELGKQKLTPKEIKEKIDLKFSEQNIEKFFSTKKAIFDAADTTEKILAVFNFKDMSKKVGNKFGLTGRDYPQRILNLLRSQRSEKMQILEAVRKYTPDLP